MAREEHLRAAIRELLAALKENNEALDAYHDPDNEDPHSYHRVAVSARRLDEAKSRAERLAKHGNDRPDETRQEADGERSKDIQDVNGS